MAITKSKTLKIDYFSYAKAFFNLMKPRVMSLVIFTCAVGLLRWSLIIFFMLAKAGFIMAIFMHLYWERWAIVNVLLWPMTAIGVFIAIMAAESYYTFFSRMFYFVVGS